MHKSLATDDKWSKFSPRHGARTAHLKSVVRQRINFIRNVTEIIIWKFNGEFV